MKNLNELQKALLKNILINYKRGLDIWIEKEELSLPDKITIFFEEKTGINFEGLKPNEEISFDFSFEFSEYIHGLNQEIDNDKYSKKTIEDLAFMLENQNWMPESNISDEVVKLANFPFPEYVEKRLML